MIRTLTLCLLYNAESGSVDNATHQTDNDHSYHISPFSHIFYHVSFFFLMLTLLHDFKEHPTDTTKLVTKFYWHFGQKYEFDKWGQFSTCQHVFIMTTNSQCTVQPSTYHMLAYLGGWLVWYG